MLKRLSGCSVLSRCAVDQATSLLGPVLTSGWSLSEVKSDRQLLSTEAKPSTNWVFLGPPGVGKGTYASRAAKAFGLEHISTGDLIRAEAKTGSELGKQMNSIISEGHLLPDEMMIQLLLQNSASTEVQQKNGVIFDGFPRTRHQAEMLDKNFDLQLVLNMSLRECILVEKLLGRRLCTKCGKNFNIANIYIAAQGSKPEVVMPPLNPPEKCKHLMEIRKDDTEEVIKNRLEIYKEKAEPVETYFEERGLLVDFEITSGIPETLPRLLETLAPYTSRSGPAEMTG